MILPLSVVLMARTAMPGETKTRLIPLLGPSGAAQLQQAMFTHSLRTAWLSKPKMIELWVCGSGDTKVLCDGSGRGLRVARQQGAHLGARMAFAAQHALRRSPAVIVVGCDCPLLSPGDYWEAGMALKAGWDAAVIVAEDGGYVLLALRQVHHQIFAGITWGSAQVWDTTWARMRRLGWRVKRLRLSWDIDRPEDVTRWLALHRFDVAFSHVRDRAWHHSCSTLQATTRDILQRAAE